MIDLTGVSELHDYNEIIKEFDLFKSYKKAVNDPKRFSTKDRIQAFSYCQDIEKQLLQAIKTFSQMYPTSTCKFDVVVLPKGVAKWDKTLYYYWFK